MENSDITNYGIYEMAEITAENLKDILNILENDISKYLIDYYIYVLWPCWRSDLESWLPVGGPGRGALPVCGYELVDRIRRIP